MHVTTVCVRFLAQSKTTHYKEVFKGMYIHIMLSVQCGCVIIMQLFGITSVVPQTGMLGWAASVHCLTEQFHSTLPSH